MADAEGLDAIFPTLRCFLFCVRMYAFHGMTDDPDALKPNSSLVVEIVDGWNVEHFSNRNISREFWFPVPTGLWTRYLPSDVCFKPLQCNHASGRILGARTRLLHR
jgi:hypothetical protein